MLKFVAHFPSRVLLFVLLRLHYLLFPLPRCAQSHTCTHTSIHHVKQVLSPLQVRSGLSARLPISDSLERFAHQHPDIKVHRLPMGRAFDEVVLEVDLISESPDPDSENDIDRPRKLLLFGDAVCNPLEPVSWLDRVASTLYGYVSSAGPQMPWTYRMFGVTVCVCVCVCIGVCVYRCVYVWRCVYMCVWR
jgi:hypothetical protein